MKNAIAGGAEGSCGEGDEFEAGYVLPFQRVGVGRIAAAHRLAMSV